MSNPSGNYGGWKAAAIGANNQAVQSILKQDYKDDIIREEAVQLALKVLSKMMMDSTSLTSEKLELAEVSSCLLERTKMEGACIVNRALDMSRAHEISSLIVLIL
ncbi:hypothetical protein DITRI_Ditri08aG0171000 [Diplodiscus trichospermus]